MEEGREEGIKKPRCVLRGWGWQDEFTEVLESARHY
jgi:hypothetical protein